VLVRDGQRVHAVPKRDSVSYLTRGVDSNSSEDRELRPVRGSHFNWQTIDGALTAARTIAAKTRSSSRSKPVHFAVKESLDRYNGPLQAP